jgi:uncharacterized protein YbbC (DUF1343 family)
MMKLGIDRLLTEPELHEKLENKRVSLLAHPASMTSDFVPTIDALMASEKINLVSCFGPQHGLRGDKQDNMVETENSVDSKHQIPVFSLYGEVRRPTQEMLDTFDVLLIDIQDVGCRIYTFITTLFYLLEDGAKANKEIWVLDRPNPAGREIEGLTLQSGQESFVGAAPMPMRHGLTLAEAANWYKDYKQLDVVLTVVEMEDYSMLDGSAYGWPVERLSWVNPSPNLATLNSARTFPGTVLLEGTNLSEGRGTTRALEQFGAPDLDIPLILKKMKSLATEWMQGVQIRESWFEPTFHKHSGMLCAGIQLHTDYSAYDPKQFKPFRFVSLFLKAIRLIYPDYALWRDFPYEYELERLAFDVINGGESLRLWIDDSNASVMDLQTRLLDDEQNWFDESKGYYLYDG